MSKDSQDTSQDVANMVKKFHIHHHSLVASNESATIAHKANYKNDFIRQLQRMKKEKDVLLLEDHRACSTASNEHSFTSDLRRIGLYERRYVQ